MTNVTQTLTLTDFLLARIAEDEGLARDAGEATDPSWARFGHRYDPKFDAAVWDVDASIQVAITGEPEAEHIARHDPAHVLAECEAKRRIVGQCERNVRDVPQGWLDNILHALALPYADHPDYREEWRA